MTEALALFVVVLGFVAAASLGVEAIIVMVKTDSIVATLLGTALLLFGICVFAVTVGPWWVTTVEEWFGVVVSD